MKIRCRQAAKLCTSADCYLAETRWHNMAVRRTKGTSGSFTVTEVMSAKMEMVGAQSLSWCILNTNMNPAYSLRLQKRFWKALDKKILRNILHRKAQKRWGFAQLRRVIRMSPAPAKSLCVTGDNTVQNHWTPGGQRLGCSLSCCTGKWFDRKYRRETVSAFNMRNKAAKRVFGFMVD